MIDQELIARLRDEHVAASRTEAADCIEELVKERDMLRDFDDYFRSMCGFKRDGKSSIECFDDFLAGINKQDTSIPLDHFLKVQKERDEALAKLAKAVEALRETDQAIMLHTDETSWRIWGEVAVSDIRKVLAELEGK